MFGYTPGSSPPQFLLLRQEGKLLCSALSQGLTILADGSSEGAHYMAFFHLSIGLERLMKVILILHHMAEHGLALPTNRELRAFGHDLGQLIAASEAIAKKTLGRPTLSIPPGSIDDDILKHLRTFATTTRYYNLDKLSGVLARTDPLENWNAILDRIFETDVRPDQRKLIYRMSADVLRGCGPQLLISGGKSFVRSIRSQFKHSIASAHAVYRVEKILARLKELYSHRNSAAIRENERLDCSQQVVPYMYEFLDFIKESYGDEDKSREALTDRVYSRICASFREAGFLQKAL